MNTLTNLFNKWHFIKNIVLKLFRTFKTPWPFVSTSSSGFQALNSVVRSTQTTNFTLSNGAAFYACSPRQVLKVNFPHYQRISAILLKYDNAITPNRHLHLFVSAVMFTLPIAIGYWITLKISLWDFNDLFLPPLYFSLSLSFPFKCLVSFPFLPPPSWWNRAHFFF